MYRYDCYEYETTRNAASSSFSSHAALLLKERHKDPQIVNNNCQVLTKCSNFDDIRRIKELVHSTFPICRIDKVNQVNQRHMYGMYSLRKEEMQLKYHNSMVEVQELSLFHVTTEKRGLQSLESGLDWRRTKRSRFGSGVSFSDDADYANLYANFNKSNSDDKRVIIVCAVLVAKKYVTKPNHGYTLEVPPKMFDTTVSPNRRVYVKYDDYEFYPLYMVYYQRRPEDICQSRYFKNNNHQNLKQLIAKEPQKQDDSLRRQEELQRQQEQRRREELQRQQEQRRREELQRQQEQKIREELRRQQEQKIREESERQLQYGGRNNNNKNSEFYQPRQEESSCLIL